MNSISVKSSDEADIIINPRYGSIIGKHIIINLPVDIPLEQLNKYNSITSRFYISPNIDIEPYSIPKNRGRVTINDASPLILTKELISNIDMMGHLNLDKFLIGINEDIDDNLTLIGYMILRNKVKKRYTFNQGQ